MDHEYNEYAEHIHACMHAHMHTHKGSTDISHEYVLHIIYINAHTHTHAYTQHKEMATGSVDAKQENAHHWGDKERMMTRAGCKDCLRERCGIP